MSSRRDLILLFPWSSTDYSCFWSSYFLFHGIKFIYGVISWTNVMELVEVVVIYWWRFKESYLWRCKDVFRVVLDGALPSNSDLLWKFILSKNIGRYIQGYFTLSVFLRSISETFLFTMSSNRSIHTKAICKVLELCYV